MDKLITAVEQNYDFMYWLVGTIALIEVIRWAIKVGSVFHEWFFKKIGVETKKMREAKAWQERLKNAESAIVEIKDTSKSNVAMFLEHEQQTIDKIGMFKNEIVLELGKLHDKIDEQRAEMDETNRANAKTDCAMLRDRIGSGMRYFSKNIKEDGNVHISLSDWENMNALFQEYFAKHGNGAFKKLYDDEFVHFTIDR
jgi:hypothetical protein